VIAGQRFDIWGQDATVNKSERLERFRHRQLSNGSARIMVTMLREAAIAPERALAEAGLRRADVERPEVTITGDQELRLERAFIELTRHRPQLWLEIGFRYRLLSYGPFGLAILNARTVARAVELAVSFHELAFTLIDYSVLRDRGGEIIGMDADLAAVPEDMQVFMVERDLAAVRRLLDDMVHATFPIREFHASIAEPVDARRYAQALGAPIRFDMPRTQVLYAPKWRDLSMPYGNPLLEEAYERQCRELVAALAVRSSEVERVVELLVRCKGRWPSIGEAAEKLGVSARTLRRRLDEKQTTYSELLEGVRRKQAEELLARTRLSVEQIADSLGYAETASFTHAFKRWTGCSPREFRGAQA
jgi:AraC-like DNA-binding protein